MKNKNIMYLLISIVILFIVLLIKINNTNINNNKISKNTVKQNIISTNKIIRNDVYIESHKGYNYKITGIVRNGTNKVIKNLKLTVNIYDKNNNKLGSSGDMMSSLEPNETWAFSIWTGEQNYIYKNLKLTYDNN